MCEMNESNQSEGHFVKPNAVVYFLFIYLSIYLFEALCWSVFYDLLFLCLTSTFFFIPTFCLVFLAKVVSK